MIKKKYSIRTQHIHIQIKIVNENKTIDVSNKNNIQKDNM